MSDVIFQRIALIGLGHIGSSIARAVKARNLVGEVIGHARSADTRAAAMRIGFCDRVEESAAEAARDADLIIICTPLGAYRSVAAEIASVLKPDAIVSDVGSVKGCALDDLQAALPAGTRIVPGHPLAGTEHSGPEAGFAELFEGRYCVLTPPEDADAAAVDQVSALWRGMGAIVETMPANHHDQVLAITSHLPHLIAYTIVGTAADLGEEMKGEVIRYAASGFRDFTRIAGSNPVMWRDIFLNNKDATLAIMQRFNEDLTQLQRAIRRGDGAALEAHFTRTRAIRRGVIEARQADMPKPTPNE